MSEYCGVGVGLSCAACGGGEGGGGAGAGVDDVEASRAWAAKISLEMRRARIRAAMRIIVGSGASHFGAGGAGGRLTLSSAGLTGVFCHSRK